jgi:predicted enzyme involved in methoxymalonyl-ACP biosynthesis
VSDRFGDLGITGIISLEIEGKNGRIVDFILSCRVMGRKIEETMLYIVIKYARSIRLKELHARYVPTSKNKPCLDFWMSSGFSYEEQNNSFSWNLFNEYTLPDCLEIVNEEDRLY